MAERGRPRAFDRDLALKRAMEVFWAKGYAGASLADLKSAMGINAPSLYAAFGSKEQLFEAAVDLYAEIEGGPLWAHFTEAPDAREGIGRLLRASAKTYTDPARPRGCLVVLGALIGGEAEARVATRLARLRRVAIDRMTARLAADVAAGRLPQGIDCQAIATFYTTVQQGMSLQARDGASRATLLAVAESAMAAWESLTHPPRAVAG
ncbi:MAG: TetR/AcrR family transcriptional regulator [Rhodospirillaceae bacterium]|nr:TetR/AcrR family transcriptional regulator [Rhodospirillaceae bacterium]